MKDASLYANYWTPQLDSQYWNATCIWASHLLTEADTWPRGERGKDERVWDEVLVKPLIKKAIGIKDLGIRSPEVFTSVH